MTMIDQLRLQEYNMRIKRMGKAEKQILEYKKTKKDRIHVVYVLESTHISGGVKIIFDHVNRLNELEVEVTIVCHYPKPHWYPINVDYIQVPLSIELTKAIPHCDVIVSTMWYQIQSCIDTGIAPVVYFEQGGEHLFDKKFYHRKYVNKQFQLPKFIITVSNQAAKSIKENFSRDAVVFHNAIDDKIFYCDEKKDDQKTEYILMMGNADVVFKGIKDIINAYKIVKDTHPEIELYWITPYGVNSDLEKEARKIFVNPSQEKIADLYRNARLFVSGSYFESFSLPVLEAMACGCPVVTTKNIGVLEYARDRENALLTKVKDSTSMADTIIKLLESTAIEKELIRNGLKTARKFTWDIIIPDLKKYYEKIAKYRVSLSWHEARERDTTFYKCKIDKGEHLESTELLDFADHLFSQQLYEEAIKCYTQFLERDDIWIEHRIKGFCNIADSYYFTGDLFKAREYCFKSFQYTLPRGEVCYRLGTYFMQESRFDEAIFWFERISDLKKPEKIWGFYDEAIWSWLPHLQLCVCYYKIGDEKTAFKHNEIARSFNPTDERVLYNKKFFNSLGYK